MKTLFAVLIFSLVTKVTLASQNTVEKEVQSAVIKYADINTGKEKGSLDLNYTIEYPNPCIAKSTVVSPITVKNQSMGNASTNRLPLLIVFESARKSEISCTQESKPTTLSYHTVIRNLVAGARYTIQISGFPELGESSSIREEQAAE